MLAIRDWLTGTLAGRALLVGILLASAGVALAAAGPPLSGLAGGFETLGRIALVAGAAIAGLRLFASLRHRLLWRVRRRLTLSYIFIGFVPALLIITFFLLCGLLIFFNVSSYLMQSRIRSLADQAGLLAGIAASELQDGDRAVASADVLARHARVMAPRYPGLSYAALPVERRCAATEAGSAGAVAPAEPMAAGAWAHAGPPSTLPSWVPCDGYAGLVVLPVPGAVRAGASAASADLVVRAVAMPRAAAPVYAVIVDIPLSAAIAGQLRADTGVALGEVAPLAIGTGPDDGAPNGAADTELRVVPAQGGEAADGFFERPIGWVAFLDHVDWETGTPGTAAAAIAMSISGMYDRISATPVAQIGNFSFGQVLLFLLAGVAGLFFIIEVVAFGTGLALARSITGSVHALFAGTERVRQGDFTHKIAVRTRDQLGQLADSFNSMTASIEDLLREKAEKERLEQELRTARAIQMSLLPQGPLEVPGLSVTGHCEPAREVGGDYYDVLPIDDRRVGILIADVAGKGTSAALYMAELKGVVLSLAQRHLSPRALLVDANRIISRHLSPYSFITVTYAVVDLSARTLTHARAGHCPLIYRPGGPAPRPVQVLAPDGLVLGLQIDNGDMFNGLLQEATVAVAPGDLFLFYTDGVTEAANAAGDWFGDARLTTLVEAHGDLPPEALRDRILAEIRAFVGTAPQHDDMTLVILRMEDAA